MAHCGSREPAPTFYVRGTAITRHRGAGGTLHSLRRQLARQPPAQIRGSPVPMSRATNPARARTTAVVKIRREVFTMGQ
jgi:hypothetical protein